MTEPPTAFTELPASAFPFTVELWGPEANPWGGPPTFTATADGPGALQVPGLGWPTWTRVTYGDGTVQWQPPPPEPPAPPAGPLAGSGP